MEISGNDKVGLKYIDGSIVKTEENPLFVKKPDDISFDLTTLNSPTEFKTIRSKNRIIKKMFKKESASQAILGLTKSVDIFGFTKGQFSLIDLIEAIAEVTGEAHLTVSTWTAANADLGHVLEFIKNNKLLSVRFLIDFSFQRRQPGVAKAIRDIFGFDSLRIGRNHAKFFQLKNDNGWNITCKTSMNLNKNPRFEDFDISNDPELFNFLNCIINEVFAKSKSNKQSEMNSGELWDEWKNS